MNRINYEKIEQYIRDDNILGKGKEVTVYDYGDSVIKIFSDNRTSPYKLISINGIEKLSELPLKYFNKPQDLIIRDGIVIGYSENKLIETLYFISITSISFSLMNLLISSSKSFSWDSSNTFTFI